MMKTLYIETGIEEEYENALIASATKIGWNVVTVMHIPFGDSFVYHKNGFAGEPISKDDLENESGWYHGSISGGKAAQRTAKWQVHAPWQELRCSVYYEELKGIEDTFRWRKASRRSNSEEILLREQA